MPPVTHNSQVVTCAECGHPMDSDPRKDCGHASSVLYQAPEEHRCAACRQHSLECRCPEEDARHPSQCGCPPCRESRHHPAEPPQADAPDPAEATASPPPREEEPPTDTETSEPRRPEFPSHSETPAPDGEAEEQEIGPSQQPTQSPPKPYAVPIRRPPPLSAPPMRVTLLRNGYATFSKEDPLLSSGMASLHHVASRIRTGPSTREKTEAYRRALKLLGDRNNTVRRLKATLPAIIPSIAVPPGFPIRDLPDDVPHTGLYVYDVDQDITPDLIPSLLEALAEYEHTAMAATSASGDALYTILAGPLAENPLHHKLLWDAIHKQLPDHLKRHTATGQNNINRTRVTPHDPHCHLSVHAVPLHLELPEVPQAPRNLIHRPRNAPPGTPRYQGATIQSITEGHQMTRLVRSALAALPQHDADDYNSWITTCYRLAGGQHLIGPAFRGKELFTEWSRTSPRYEPGAENVFDRCILDWDGRATVNGIFTDATANGWRRPNISHRTPEPPCP